MIFKKILLSLFVLFTIIIPIIIINNTPRNSSFYQDRLMQTLDKKSEVSVSEVFDFEFDKAYVFKDNYISGNTFVKEYNIDISINQVKTTDHEYIRRIVFVDENGDFIYNFTFRSYELNVKNEGVIIYPDTKLKKTEPIYENAVTFEFLNAEYY